MPQRQKIAKLNREHLLRPVNVILFIIAIIIIASTQYFGHTIIALGYTCAVMGIFAHVLLATKRKVTVSPTGLLIIEPAIYIGLAYLVDYLFL